MLVCVCKQVLSENSVVGIMRDPLIAASHAAIILSGLLREHLGDRGERCGADGMTNEGRRRIRTNRIEDGQL